VRRCSRTWADQPATRLTANVASSEAARDQVIAKFQQALIEKDQELKKLTEARDEKLTDMQKKIADLATVEADLTRAREEVTKLQTEVRSVLEDGMSSGAFPNHDIRRALALVFDLTHRFFNPSSIRADAEVTRAQIDGRFERVLRALRRALAAAIL
jgi:hypothetical protein